LTTISRSVKIQKDIKLPLEKLITLYISNSESPFLKNFSHIYISMGFERISEEEKLLLFPVLFSKLSIIKDEDHKSMVLRLIIDMIKTIKISNKEEERRKTFEFLKEKENLDVLLEYFQDFLFYQSNYSITGDKIIIPNGLTINSLKRIIGTKGIQNYELFDYKVILYVNIQLEKFIKFLKNRSF
jgi:hypothetical protein